MTARFKPFLVLEVVGASIVLLLSVRPGVIRDVLLLVMLSAIVWLPAALIAAAVALLVDKRRNGFVRWPTARECTILLAVPTLTVIGVLSGIPLRAAFMGSRASFERAVAATPVSRYGVAFSGRVGVYRVDKRAMDPRGGTFFRVYAGADGLSPDIMSYGFVKQPNREGTPFGAARYEVHSLGDGWYWFRASDDWY